MSDKQSMTLEQYIEFFLSARPGARRRDVAKQLDISDAFLSQIIKGIRRPSYDAMQKIALRTGGVVSIDSWSRRPPKKRR